MATYPYYQYTLTTSTAGGGVVGAITSTTGTAVTVTETAGSPNAGDLSDLTLSDARANGQAADTFAIGGTVYTFTGGFTSGTYQGDFTATAGGTTYFFSHLSTLPANFDVDGTASGGGAGAGASSTGYIGQIGNNASGAATLRDALTVTLTCFLAGTMIRTPQGETAVDKLAIGDLVVTADGSAKPVKFIGRQSVAMLFADRSKAQPVLIKAGALAENVPARDLYTSPGHAMALDGLLAISAALINGTSIVRWDDTPPVFTYYHVELEGHEIIFAEGAATETYCDNVPRDVFDNAADYRALYPNATPIMQLDMPTVKSARQLPRALREHLDERARAIGAAGVEAAQSCRDAA